MSCVDPLDCCSVSKGPWQGARSSLGVVVSNRSLPHFPAPLQPLQPIVGYSTLACTTPCQAATDSYAVSEQGVWHVSRGCSACHHHGEGLAKRFFVSVFFSPLCFSLELVAARQQYGYCGTTVDHCLISNGCQVGMEHMRDVGKARCWAGWGGGCRWGRQAAQQELEPRPPRHSDPVDGVERLPPPRPRPIHTLPNELSLLDFVVEGVGVWSMRCCVDENKQACWQGEGWGGGVVSPCFVFFWRLQACSLRNCFVQSPAPCLTALTSPQPHPPPRCPREARPAHLPFACCAVRESAAYWRHCTC